MRPIEYIAAAIIAAVIIGTAIAAWMAFNDPYGYGLGLGG